MKTFQASKPMIVEGIFDQVFTAEINPGEDGNLDRVKLNGNFASFRMPPVFYFKKCKRIRIRVEIVNDSERGIGVLGRFPMIGIGLEDCEDCLIEYCVVEFLGGIGIVEVRGKRNQYYTNKVRDCERGYWLGNSPMNSSVQHPEGEVSWDVRVMDCWARETWRTGFGGIVRGRFDLTGNSALQCGRSGNFGSGIAIGGEADLVICQGNQCVGNPWAGIQYDVPDSLARIKDGVIRDNTCWGNGLYGIYPVKCEKTLVENNDCRGNLHSIVATDRDSSGNPIGTENLTIRNNLIDRGVWNDQTVNGLVLGPNFLLLPDSLSGSGG